MAAPAPPPALPEPEQRAVQAPRLLGADARAGLLLMEDLGDGATLADSLMAAAALGVACHGVAEEIDRVHRMIIGTSYLGLVHGDPCPDNVRLVDGTCRIVDYEYAGWGPVAYDAAYLLAPFPSCWCFARLPAEVAGPAVEAYRASLGTAGVELGPDWESLTTAVLAAAFLGRGQTFAEALDQDDEWGTTTMRPRLLAWLRTFTGRAGDGTLPRLQATAAAMQTGSPSAGPGFASRTTRPSRRPARPWHGHRAGGSPSRDRPRRRGPPLSRRAARQGPG
jgi:phosphotransferase family enzyme